jgi:hypothetical protein
MHSESPFSAVERQLLRARPVSPSTLPSLRDWFPVTLQADGISWRHVPGRFTASFFADTLRQQTPAERQVCTTPMDWLDRLEPGLAPSAFIFHASRCGSTLLTQLLATLPSCIVLSEPPVIDAFLRGHQQASGTSGGVARLRQLILALGQQRSVDETHFFIKLDCWHIQYLPLLRAAFPDTPCWFLYREPGAILASHQRQRGPQMVPGLIMPRQIGTEDLAPGDLDGYCAQVLASLFQSALLHAGHLRWLHYAQLPDILWHELMPQLGLYPTPSQLQAMRQRAGFHAKDQSSAFRGDPPPAVAATHPLFQQLVAPLYAQLEQCRLTA